MMKRMFVWIMTAVFLLTACTAPAAQQPAAIETVTVESTVPATETPAPAEPERFDGCYENDSFDTAIVRVIGDEYVLSASLYRLMFLDHATGALEGDQLVFHASDDNGDPIMLTFGRDGETYTLRVEKSASAALPAGTVIEGLRRTADAPFAEGVYEEPEETPAPVQGHYTFSPKVCPVYMEEVFGKDMCDAWYSLVDAVLAGEDTFACKDQFTYDWVMGQFGFRCLPILPYLIDYAEDREHSVKDGVAQFTYRVPPEEARMRIAEFGEQIEGILNEALADDYSDFEKALALYIYFAHHYSYDYDTFEQMYVTYQDDISAYRFFREGKGICQEISTAYSYLLMQAGVEATTMMGADHQWSYVRICGRNYHIDPTFVISETDSLAYFLMTDAQREATGYAKEGYTITSNFAQDHPHPDYTADDDHFSPLWTTWYDALSHETHTLTCAIGEDANGEWQYLDFDYAGY